MQKYESPTGESIADLLIATLMSARSVYLFRKIRNERALKRQSENSLRVALSRLSTKGYVVRSSDGWAITTKGKLYAKNIKAKKLLEYIPSPFIKNSQSSIIISFDIPEHSRVLRNWLRNQIKIFGYKMLQQSLWVGPGPLPKEFLSRLEKLNIKNNVKTFNIKPAKN